MTDYKSTVSDSDHQDPMSVIAELALIRVDADSPEQTLRRVAELAKSCLGSVLDVSLTMVEDGRPRSMVFTGSLASDLDERQYELGFGPCLDTARTGQTIVVNEDGDSPYREFAQLAARAGVRQIVAVGLPISQRSIGALNIYCSGESPGLNGFLENAEVFAAYAAVVVNNVTSYDDAANEATNLRLAMRSRAVIEQATGIVMVRDLCTAEEASDLLCRISQHQNIPLRQLARTLVDSYEERRARSSWGCPVEEQR